MTYKVAAASASLLLASSIAHAATVDWTSYTVDQLDQARTDRANIAPNVTIAFEDFENESFDPVPLGGGPGTSTAGGLMTNVGTFTTTDSTSTTCAGSCNEPDNESLIRSASGFGRYNTTEGGSKWLDSNDNAAINLTTKDGLFFDSVVLFLTDVDDVGPKTFSIFVNGEEFDISSEYDDTTLPGSQTDPDNADLFLISIGLDTATSNVALSFAIDDNDGFGLDDVLLGSATPVPVPATLPLLAAGIGLMGWASRRRKNA